MFKSPARGLSRPAFSKMALLGLLAATAACSRGSDDATPRSAASDPIASVAPPVTSSPAPVTTSQPSATTAATTAAPTTAPTEPAATTPASVTNACADFVALDAYGRMLAAEEGTAPTDSACADDVAKATAAVTVLRRTEQAFPYYYHDAEGAFYVDDGECAGLDSTCDELKNVYDESVIFFGAWAPVDDDDQPVAFIPFITSVVQPGESVTVDRGDGSLDPAPSSLASAADVTVAAVGDNAADAGLIPAPPDDPQASDDPAVWFPTLVDHTTLDQATLVDRFQDIHSPEVVPPPAGEEYAEYNATTVPDVKTVTTFCQEIPVTPPAGVEGQLTMILYARTNDGDSPLYSMNVGLFRRGSDNRWRWAGSELDTWLTREQIPDDPCNIPLQPLRDSNAAQG